MMVESLLSIVGVCNFFNQTKYRGICGAFGKCELFENREEDTPELHYWWR